VTVTLKRSGFILVVTLVMIAMAGILLTGVCRHSLAMSVAVHESSERIQKRWGAASCQRVVFSMAREILSDVIARGDGHEIVRPVPTSSLSQVLGGMEFELVLADEQAKVNVNLLDANLDREQTARTLTGLIGLADVEVSLRPLVAPNVAADGLAYKNWEQVFRARSAHATDYADQLTWATRHVTCWSPGSRLHVWAASDEAIRCVTGLVLSPIEIDRLIEERGVFSPGQLPKLLDSLDVTRRKRVLLERLLDDTSESVSLWITIRTEGLRSDMFAVRMTESDVTRTYVSTW
jgi:hypothetical protein